MHDPHISKGGGIVAKAEWKCDNGQAIEFDLQLFLCDSDNITRDKQWLANHCTRKGRNADAIRPPLDGSLSDPRYVPRKADKPGGAHGEGYWIALNTWWTMTFTEGDAVYSVHAPYFNV